MDGRLDLITPIIIPIIHRVHSITSSGSSTRWPSIKTREKGGRRLRIKSKEKTGSPKMYIASSTHKTAVDRKWREPNRRRRWNVKSMSINPNNPTIGIGYMKNLLFVSSGRRECEWRMRHHRQRIIFERGWDGLLKVQQHYPFANITLCVVCVQHSGVSKMPIYICRCASITLLSDSLPQPAECPFRCTNSIVDGCSIQRIEIKSDI